MKKLKFIAVLAFTALLTASCYTGLDTEIASLERRVSNLNQRAQAINENVAALQILADKYKSYIYVTSYRTLYSGKEVIGYALNLSDGSTITLKNGVSKDDPIVGLTLGDDGIYYWIITVNGVTDYIYDEVGLKVAATVASPIMKIVDGIWMVSFDNGYVWQRFDKASGDDGKSFVDSIVTRGDYIYLYLVSGQTVKFPTYSLYENYLTQLNDLNANLAALQAIYEAKAANTFVKTVVPIEQDGETVGYNMVFSDDTSITVYNGRSYEAETNIGLALNDDGEYYWAIVGNGQTQWLYDDVGRMVMASPTEGLAPVFMLDNSFGDGKYYWAYKYGDAGYWRYLYDGEGNKVVATDTNAAQIFSVVEVTDNYVKLTPTGGTAFYLPRYKVFTVNLSSTSVTVPSSTGKVEVMYEVVDVQATAAITAITQSGYRATTTKSYDTSLKTLHGVITIYAENNAPNSSSVLLLVSDGDGHTEKFTISVVKE